MSRQWAPSANVETERRNALRLLRPTARGQLGVRCASNGCPWMNGAGPRRERGHEPAWHAHRRKRWTSIHRRRGGPHHRPLVREVALKPRGDEPRLFVLLILYYPTCRAVHPLL